MGQLFFVDRSYNWDDCFDVTYTNLEQVKNLDAEVVVEVTVARPSHVVDKHQAVSLCLNAKTHVTSK